MKIVVQKVQYRGTCGTKRKESRTGRGSHQTGSQIRGICASPVGSPEAEAGVQKHLVPSRNGDVLVPPPCTVVCVQNSLHSAQKLRGILMKPTQRLLANHSPCIWTANYFQKGQLSGKSASATGRCTGGTFHGEPGLDTARGWLSQFRFLSCPGPDTWSLTFLFCKMEHNVHEPLRVVERQK